MAPDRIQLQNMTKRGNETFKEYVQRWRELASQVEPPYLKKKMVTMFINTLQPPFYDKMIGSVSSNFSDLVIIGERVEMGLKSGKIASGYTGLNNTKKLPAGANKKKEEESHFVASNLANPSFVRRPYAATTSEPPYPKGYDSNAVCDYHSGAVGHSTENCLALKFKVHDLLKAGWLNFKENEPSVKNNPLPVHGGPIVNAIEENHQVIKEVEKIKAPMGLIFSELSKLPCDGTYMRPSPMVVRAFDGSRREVMGEIDLPVQIGPVTFEITLHVMDIVPAYSCLLGRPWIHYAGVVPSTLHQKLKYMINDQLVIVSGEGDLLVSNLSTTPYVETTKDALETAFQTLEIVDTAYVETTPIEPHMSNTAIMVAKFMLSRGHHPWHELGKDEEGLREPVELPENRDKWGLGYKPTRDDKRRLVKEKKEKN
ncbi:uncharacterized protein [Cicer arietinum]|uniref:uncharacterized protein n=1 Tax=Cicer arietinum TaxID=3827 RepID=UPI003CC6149E